MKLPATCYKLFKRLVSTDYINKDSIQQQKNINRRMFFLRRDRRVSLEFSFREINFRDNGMNGCVLQRIHSVFFFNLFGGRCCSATEILNNGATSIGIVDQFVNLHQSKVARHHNETEEQKE